MSATPSHEWKRLEERDDITDATSAGPRAMVEGDYVEQEETPDPTSRGYIYIPYAL